MSQRSVQIGQPARQMMVQKNNILSVCRLAVKSLIDKATYEVVDSESAELLNFCAILEHLFNFRIKNDNRWFGSENFTSFWGYIRTACSCVPHNCILSIENLERVRTARGKGRAWIRMALMEKRLAEYITTAVHQRKLTRAWYQDGAIVLSEDMQEICGVLMGLCAIDFSFDLRSQDLDYRNIPVIDFTPYLKFEQSPQSMSLDMQEGSGIQSMMSSVMSASVSSEVFDDEEHCDKVKMQFSEMDRQYKTVSEQKGYLEELLRLRESQLDEIQRQQKRVMDTLTHYQDESRKERQQLESVIIELQAQINNMKAMNRAEVLSLQTQLKRQTAEPPAIRQPDIVLQELASIPRTPRPPLPGRSSFLNSPEIVVKYASSHARPIQFDTKSVMSDTSNISTTREETQSLVPLAGSFTSNVSPDQSSHVTPVHLIADQSECSIAATDQSESSEKQMDQKELALPLQGTQAAKIKENTLRPNEEGSQPDLVAHCNAATDKNNVEETTAEKIQAELEETVDLRE